VWGSFLPLTDHGTSLILGALRPLLLGGWCAAARERRVQLAQRAAHLLQQLHAAIPPAGRRLREQLVQIRVRVAAQMLRHLRNGVHRLLSPKPTNHHAVA